MQGPSRFTSRPALEDSRLVSDERRPSFVTLRP
jgi:hypothetical protein